MPGTWATGQAQAEAWPELTDEDAQTRPSSRSPPCPCSGTRDAQCPTWSQGLGCQLWKALFCGPAALEARGLPSGNLSGVAFWEFPPGLPGSSLFPRDLGELPCAIRKEGILTAPGSIVQGSE